MNTRLKTPLSHTCWRPPSKRLQALSGENHWNEREIWSRDTHILTSMADVVLGKAAEDSFKAVSEFYKVDQDILIAETAVFHNLEGVELKTVIKVVNYLQSNSLWAKNPCSADRSFSCLRRLKTYLRSTMAQDRLSALGLLCIERDHANRVDINTIVEVFGRRKGRDKMFF